MKTDLETHFCPGFRRQKDTGTYRLQIDWMPEQAQLRAFVDFMNTPCLRYVNFARRNYMKQSQFLGTFKLFGNNNWTLTVFPGQF